MNLSRLSKTRLAAMSITAKSCKEIIDVLPGIKVLEEYEPAEHEEDERGLAIWNELSTTGLKLRTRDHLARCFEIMGGITVVPEKKKFPQVRVYQYTYNSKRPHAAVVPTKNTNGHDYPLHDVCVLDEKSRRSGAMRRAYSRVGNQLPMDDSISLPSPESLMVFFKSGSGIPIHRIKEFYDAELLSKAMANIDACIENINEYEEAIQKLIKINNKFPMQVIPIE